MELDDFREELLDAIQMRLPVEPTKADREFALICEIGERLTQAEEFSDLIPSHFLGTGSKGRKLRVDGYELDESDDSLRLVVADFGGAGQVDALTRIRAEALFGQLQAFVEDALSGRIWNNVPAGMEDGLELASMIADRHAAIVRYRFYLFTDANLSERVKDLPQGEIDGHPIEYHIWDIDRLNTLSSSTFGAEELEIDFTRFVPGGLPCLAASQAEDYQGYLAVIPGDALAELYDSYGSKLLEGNVRSYLSASGKINKGIQGTIRKEPERFFVYNNGISATATSATVVETPMGHRLVSARYFQIVNGGQTTASLHVASRKDKADLQAIHVQMKLSVVTARDIEKLDDMIQSIAMYSNKQNKVSDADFFSNHPYHRAVERLSRRIPTPRVGGAQYDTYWFYERARGQYQNEQSGLSQKQKRDFQRENPRAQLLVKTDLAKFENSWRQLPHIVSAGAQKNFTNFADIIDKVWGDDGAALENDGYFKEVIARAILFKSVEKLVSAAAWYNGGYRANIVTYSIAKLASMIELQKPGYILDFRTVWANQAISEALTNQLDAIAKEVVTAITTPPVAQMNITEWCKKKDCWEKVVSQPIRLSDSLALELVHPGEARNIERDQRQQGKMDIGIHSQTEVMLKGTSYWAGLAEWARQFSPIFGKESDLVRNASKKGWTPTPLQAACLIKVSQRLESEGFKQD
ncbi:MAG: AIPR family protein [Thiobacillus sp.]|uniref:AIPR family protein n=1 Tax=Thiobacillus sp. TaxID=924 RepID=UPI002893B7FC|nr:AIPR family protein [Thiobacillus sp.]MDT3706284.1 AIPR family protein [Thiobacillus sp.]